MIQIKKTILTLVALFAMTTGAWADAVPVTELKASDINAWIGDDTALTAADLPGFTAVSDEEVVNIPAPLTNGSIFMIYAFNGTNIKFVTYYNGAQVVKGEDYYNRDNIAYNAFDAGYIIYYTGTAPPPLEVAWNKTSNTGSFTMPGGNVELEPEYYPQAALTAAPTAINDVPATTDGAIIEAGTVKNIGETATAQGTLMYYVSPSALDDAALLALAADQWTADVPTAKSLAEGEAHVYYYVRGNDGNTDDETFSDGNILAANALTVTIAAEPTYAVTFADDTAEPDKWTADPATGLKKGQTVTVTYTGSKKVIGVKAEKKAAAAATISFTVMRATAGGNNSVTYTVAPGTTWQQFIESGDAPACLSIGKGKVCHDMDCGLTCCCGTFIANVADKKRVKASDAIIDGATYGCSDYCDYEDHD